MTEAARDDLPVFACKTGSHTWTFWCPHCRIEHTHGAGAGHRVAHCASGPYKARGYVLAAGGEAAKGGQ
ncbi:hypothetical protein [Roseateles sp.]|uniref:hypothetical protein n=1 Tax=Roseateles sp. TaxID=1971397 RepID=UPI002E0CBCA2|nr:hypothetical protein [Roseateles sp.]